MKLLLVFTLLMSQFSCFTPSKEQSIYEEIESLKKKTTSLEKNTSERDKTVDQVHRKTTASLESEVERLKLVVSQLQGEIQSLRMGVDAGEMPGTENPLSPAKRIQALEEKITELSEKGSQTSSRKKAEGKSEETASAITIDSASELRKAFEAKKFKDVISAYPSLAAEFKKPSSKEESLYYYGESLYQTAQYSDAALSLNEFIDKFPKSTKILAVKIRMGDSYIKLGDKDVAKVYYDEVVKQGGTSAEAKLAKSKLSKL